MSQFNPFTRGSKASVDYGDGTLFEQFKTRDVNGRSNNVIWLGFEKFEARLS